MSQAQSAGKLKKIKQERNYLHRDAPPPPPPPPATATAISQDKDAEEGFIQELDGDALDVHALLRTVAALEAQEANARKQTREVITLLHAAARALALENERSAGARAMPKNEAGREPPVTPPLAEMAGDANPLNTVIQHPGALCSTKVHIKREEAKRSATVTLQTECKCVGEACESTAMEMNDYVALASRALVDRAADMSRETALQVRGVDPDHKHVHREIMETLQHGQVVSARPNDVVSKFGHPSYFVTLQHPQTMKTLNAIFKPKVEGDGDGWHRASIEWVAYELNRMLGMDYVPPAAYRTGGVDVDYVHYEEGAFILFVEQAKELQEAPSGSRGVPLSRLLSDTRILDVLLHNSDRHHGHFLHGEHWAIRNPDHSPMMRPVLIDHAAGFRSEAFVSMEHENAFQTGPVMSVPARTFLRLRFLDAKRIAQKFGGVLTEQEMRGVLHRRNVILDYLDNLVEKHGYNQAVVE